MSDRIEREMGWDDEWQADGTEFVLAPAGDYDFEVTYLERGRHQPKPGGNGKLPECPKAEASLRIITAGEQVTIKHNLFLHSRCEGMVSAFLRSIGRKKHGQAVHPDWGTIVGARGRCKIGVREWTGQQGVMKSNEVKKFYDFDETKASTDFTPNEF